MIQLVHRTWSNSICKWNGIYDVYNWFDASSTTPQLIIATNTVKYWVLKIEKKITSSWSDVKKMSSSEFAAELTRALTFQECRQFCILDDNWEQRREVNIF